MRIIAGTARGRKIFSVPERLPVKPISDRIKQSLFDIIRPRITGAVVLDLFAGTGNVSLEALSRGALKTVMVDIEPACLKVMARNLQHLGFAERAKVLKGDILKGVAWLGAYGESGVYDIIFMGPPYRDIKNRPLSFTGPVLADIAGAGILAQDGIIIAQHHQNETFDTPPNLELYREEKYGDTLIHFFRHKQ